MLIFYGYLCISAGVELLPDALCIAADCTRLYDFKVHRVGTTLYSDYTLKDLQEKRLEDSFTVV